MSGIGDGGPRGFGHDAFRNLVGGRWQGAVGGGTATLVDPASERPIDTVPFGGAEDVVAAIDAASAAFPAWSRHTPYARAGILERAADWIDDHLDDLAVVTTEESGKPLSEARAEWRSATGYLRWFAGEGVRAYGRTVPARAVGRRIRVEAMPVGVVGTITAWNFPVYNNVRTWAAALAAGCTLVARPDERTPRTGMLLARALHEGGAPDGVVNLVNGAPRPMGRAMLDDPRLRKLAFTGSPAVGRLLMDGASRTMTRLTLELGGNAPVLVFPDVDVAEAARKAAVWKTRNCGQVCVAPQRFLVHDDVADAFLEAVAAEMAALRVGPGLDEASQVGPLISARQRERVEALVAGSLEAGARLVTGGARPDRPGWFYRPTVLGDVTPGMPAFDEEIFGPVLPVTRFRDGREALALANRGEAGLAAFVVTNDLATATLVAERLEYGMVSINDWLPATPEAPFGGMKGSGFGRETGSEGLREYLETKAVFLGGIDEAALD